MAVNGEHADGLLAAEAGMCRLVRISPTFEANYLLFHELLDPGVHVIAAPVVSTATDGLSR